MLKTTLTLACLAMALSACAHTPSSPSLDTRLVESCSTDGKLAVLRQEARDRHTTREKALEDAARIYARVPDPYYVRYQQSLIDDIYDHPDWTPEHARLHTERRCKAYHASRTADRAQQAKEQAARLPEPGSPLSSWALAPLTSYYKGHKCTARTTRGTNGTYSSTAICY